MRKIDVRVDVLRNNVKVTELSLVAAPSIKASADAEIKTSMTAEFAPNDKVNWLTDELNPILIIDDVEYPYGLYTPTTYSVSDDGTLKTIKVEAYDRCWILKAKKTSNIIHLSKNANYVEVIKNLLAECGFALTMTTPTNLTLATDREDWDIGTDYLKIVNQLLKEISYNPIWFDEKGYAVIEPKEQMTGLISKHYDFNNIKSLCIDLSSTIDFFNAPNVFLCICSNPDHSLWTATAKNTNPSSPLSTVRRGKEIIKLVKVSNIASSTELQNYADNLCYENMMIYQTIQLKTGILTGIGINDIVSIVHKDFHGLARETSWSVTLEPNGEMLHVLEATSLNITSELEEETVATIAGIAIAGISVVGVA